MKQGAVSLTTRSLYMIFLVIFVMLLLYSVLNTRTSQLKQKDYFDTADHLDSLFVALLNSPCLVVDYYQDAPGEGGNPTNYQTGIRSYLSAAKLDSFHNENRDVHCVDNYQFLYSVQVKDILTQAEWRLGLRADPSWIDQGDHGLVSRALPVSINYNFEEIHPGLATITAFMGEIPKFYGSIKLACITKEQHTFPLNQPETVSYNSTDTRFCVGDDCFYSYFPCRVQDFSFPPGDYLVFLNYHDHQLEVVT